MPHQRTLIRQAVRTLLLDETGAEDRVFASRKIPHRKNDLPVVCIYILSEDADDEDTAPRELRRDAPLTIEAYVSADTDVDVAMDDIALEIETAMHADPTLAGTVGDAVLDTTELELVEIGDREVGVVTLTYALTYHVLAPEAPDEDEMDDFVRAYVQHGTDRTVEDVVEVQEQ